MASPDLDPAGVQASRAALSLGLRRWLEEGLSLELRLRLGLRLELGLRHSCGGDSPREITGSCKNHQTGAYGFLLFLTEMLDQRRKSCPNFASGPDIYRLCFEKQAVRWVWTSATGTNNLANKWNHGQTDWRSQHRLRNRFSLSGIFRRRLPDVLLKP